MLRYRHQGFTTGKEPSRPSEGPHVVAFLASGFFWLMFFISPFLLFFNRYESIFVTFIIRWPFVLFFQLLGVFLTVSGVVLANFGRIARGMMAPSWGMPEEYQLATKGAYRFVRHPLYTSYLSMALGLVFLLANGLLLGCFFGLLFYYHITKYEKDVLMERFGSQYEEYMQQVGIFFPKIRKKKG